MDRPIKVLHLSSESTWRGGEQQIIYLVEETRKLGIEAVIGCRQGSEVEAYCKENDLPFYSLPFKSAYDVSTARQIIRIYRKEKFDLIQTHTSKSHTMSVIAGLLGLMVPQIMTRRVDFPVKDNWFSRFKYNYFKITRIICISETIRRITEPDIRDKSKLVTIHSGTDMEKFTPYEGSDWLRKEYGLRVDTKVIGNTSAISNQKDYPTFLKSAERILQENKDVKFFIIGDGPERKEIENMVKALGLSQDVIFTGFRKNIREILPSLDIFLFTSQTEGLGTSVLDAMAAGVPIVATNAGGVSEMVNHQKNGMLCPIKDADCLSKRVLHLLENPELSKELVKEGRETVKNFSKQKTAQRTVELYHEILKEKATQKRVTFSFI